MTNWTTWALAAGTFGLTACPGEPPKAGAGAPPKANAPIEEKLAQYTTVTESTSPRCERRVTRFMAERGRLSTQLQQDLAGLGSKGIPVDIVFDQGPEMLQ